MGESPSARTQRELEALRSSIDSDVQLLQDRLRQDVDPRRLAKRNPVAVFGGLASLMAIGVVTTVRSLSERKSRRSDTDIDALIARLGGRMNKLRGRARKRLRSQLRDEIGDVQQAPKPQQMLMQSISGALTAAFTLVAQRFASRLVGDEELPSDPVETTARSSG